MNASQLTLSGQLTQFAHVLQDELFGRLEEETGPIKGRTQLFVAACAMIPFARFLPISRQRAAPRATASRWLARSWPRACSTTPTPAS